MASAWLAPAYRIAPDATPPSTMLSVPPLLMMVPMVMAPLDTRCVAPELSSVALTTAPAET